MRVSERHRGSICAVAMKAGKVKRQKDGSKKWYSALSRGLGAQKLFCNGWWTTQFTHAKKSNISPRLCINYGNLNDVVKMASFPLLHVNDLLDYLHGANCWQVEVAGADVEKAAFIVPNGFHGIQATIFGLHNAASTFQLPMQTTFSISVFKVRWWR